jgi:hypothetical protein
MPGRTWSVTVDGTELNNHDWSECIVPDADNGFPGNVIWVPIAGDVPWYVRVQPQAGRYTVMVQLHAMSADGYETRRAQLAALFAPGPHTLGLQIRGGTSARQIPTISDGGWAWEYTNRRFTITLQAAAAG